MNEQPQTDEWLADGEARVNTYRLLSEAFHVPDHELLELLEDVAGDDDLRVTVAIGGLVSELPDEIQSLRVDYAKLFVGPRELLAPPYGSVYLDGKGQVMTDSTMDVERRYRQEELDVTLDEPADHVAAELEFMYLLAHREVTALDNAEFETATTYLQKQQAFLGTHLGRWLPEFADRVEENAETEFYRLLAREAATFVSADSTRLADRLDEVQNSSPERIEGTDDSE
ncbi:MAG: molecular chaperone TorD family protein [Halovenus sp.]|mgnify:CR=1 FL=1